MNMKSMIGRGMAAICLGLAIQASHAAEEVPVEHFANLPLIKSPTVSPDGKHVAAMIRNDSGYYDVMVTDFEKLEFRPLASLKKAYDRIDYIKWGNNERLLVSASYPVQVARFRFRTSKLYSFDINTGDQVQLSYREPRNSLYTEERQKARNDSNIVSRLPNDPDHVLVALRGAEDIGPSLFKVNIYENTFEKVVTNENYISNWYATREGEVLLAVGWNPEKPDEDLLYRIWYRESVDDEWHLLRELEAFKDFTFSPVGTVNDGKILVMSDYKLGRDALWEYDIESGEFVRTVFAAPEHDLAGALESESGDITGVYWYEDYRKQHYFDEADAELNELVQKTFKGAEVNIASMDDARKRIIVAAVQDNVPPKYFQLDLTKGKAGYWLSEYPHLDKIQLPEKRPFEYEARDGMKLNGYITLPVNAKGKPPLIVMPHGGPTARDYRYFDWWSSLLASRGYAVLQPNFRGSAGFGNEYEVSGYRQWGKAMQDDVLDAIAWVKENELADTENMCMVGASYGGYVTLTASVQTPEMFKCFVSFAGISDVHDLVHSISRFYDSYENFEITIGDPENADDVADLKAHSAINFIERLSRPVLLIHGDEDTQVQYQQSKRFYELADRAGKDVEFILQEDGTHYMDFGPHRLEAMRETLEFLEEHLD